MVYWRRGHCLMMSWHINIMFVIIWIRTWVCWFHIGWLYLSFCIILCQRIDCWRLSSPLHHIQPLHIDPHHRYWRSQIQVYFIIYSCQSHFYPIKIYWFYLSWLWVFPSLPLSINPRTSSYSLNLLLLIIVYAWVSGWTIGMRIGLSTHCLCLSVSLPWSVYIE